MAHLSREFEVLGSREKWYCTWGSSCIGVGRSSMRWVGIESNGVQTMSGRAHPEVMTTTWRVASGEGRRAVFCSDLGVKRKAMGMPPAPGLWCKHDNVTGDLEASPDAKCTT